MRHGWSEKEDLAKLKQHQQLPRLSAAGVATSSQSGAGHHIILDAMLSYSKELSTHVYYEVVLMNTVVLRSTSKSQSK
eukprot:5808058-Pyramimonas_sp.AAC.1